MKSIYQVLLSAIAVLGFGCNSAVAPQTPDELSNALAVWGDDLTYGYLDDDESDGKQALKVARKNSSFSDYYARFKVGNLGIVEGSTPPPPYVMDADGRSGYIAVITGKTPYYFALPNKELFAHYMKLIRKNLAQNKPDQRYRIMHVLAGIPYFMDKSEVENFANDRLNVVPQDPTWVDENGTLTVEYFSTQADSGMTAPYLIQCRLVVDSEQQFTIKCDQVPYLEDTENE